MLIESNEELKRALEACPTDHRGYGWECLGDSVEVLSFEECVALAKLGLPVMFSVIPNGGLVSASDITFRHRAIFVNSHQRLEVLCIRK